MCFTFRILFRIAVSMLTSISEPGRMYMLMISRNAPNCDSASATAALLMYRSSCQAPKGGARRWSKGREGGERQTTQRVDDQFQLPVVLNIRAVAVAAWEAPSPLFTCVEQERLPLTVLKEYNRMMLLRKSCQGLSFFPTIKTDVHQQGRHTEKRWVCPGCSCRRRSVGGGLGAPYLFALAEQETPRLHRQTLAFETNGFINGLLSLLQRSPFACWWSYLASNVRL